MSISLDPTDKKANQQADQLPYRMPGEEQAVIFLRALEKENKQLMSEVAFMHKENDFIRSLLSHLYAKNKIQTLYQDGKLPSNDCERLTKLKKKLDRLYREHLQGIDLYRIIYQKQCDISPGVST
jgi:hypothetical protein